MQSLWHKVTGGAAPAEAPAEAPEFVIDSYATLPSEIIFGVVATFAFALLWVSFRVWMSMKEKSRVADFAEAVAFVQSLSLQIDDDALDIPEHLAYMFRCYEQRRNGVLETRYFVRGASIYRFIVAKGKIIEVRTPVKTELAQVDEVDESENTKFMIW